MGISTFRLSCAFAAALLPAIALAQTLPIKPGLWEITSDRGTGGQKSAQAAERLKNMPPEARAKIEAMMKENGVAISSDGTTRMCMTKESMDPARWAGATACKTDYTTRSSSSWKWHSVCTQPEAVVDGEAVFANVESFAVTTSTTMALGGGTKAAPHKLQGKWVSGDCGDLKPFDPRR
jgi:hypothetical protein